MKDRFKIGLYNLLSKDKRIRRFKEFHEIEGKTVVFFLMQVGKNKDERTQDFKKMLCLNEKICIKKTYISYINNNELYTEGEKVPDLDKIDQEIEEYEKLKNILQEHIEKLDKTEDKKAVVAFKSLVLYQENIQKLYEEGAKDKTKILELFKEIIV